MAPFFRRSAPSIAPAIYRTIQFFGADTSITELRGPICALEDQDRVWHTLRTYFRREFREWDLIQWDGIREQAWRQSGDFTACLPNYFIRLPRSWPELHRQISGNFRRNMRKQRELFEQDRHSYEIRIIHEPKEMSEALGVLFGLHSQRAQVDDMDVKHFDRFAHQVNWLFLTEYSLAMASRKKAHIFELAVNGKTVATQLAFTMDKDLWMYTSGFDPDWRRYGVMTMLTVEIMQWAMRSGYEIVNLSCGSDRGKTRWRPSEVVFSQLLECAPGLRGRFAMQAHETIGLARRLKKRLKGYRLRTQSRGSTTPANDEQMKSERDQPITNERQPPSSFRQPGGRNQGPPLRSDICLARQSDPKPAWNGSARARIPLPDRQAQIRQRTDSPLSRTCRCLGGNIQFVGSGTTAAAQ